MLSAIEVSVADLAFGNDRGQCRLEGVHGEQHVVGAHAIEGERTTPGRARRCASPFQTTPDHQTRRRSGRRSCCCKPPQCRGCGPALIPSHARSGTLPTGRPAPPCVKDAEAVHRSDLGVGGREWECHVPLAAETALFTHPGDPGSPYALMGRSGGLSDFDFQPPPALIYLTRY
jgi:hypothetical protein